MEKNENNQESSLTSTISLNHGKQDEGKKTKVSSTAIVKYEAQLPVLPYAKLQQDTNLNIAPANWLRDGRFSNTFPTNRNPLQFSSFGIAHTFLDNIGDVDVISDAENIKKLLKMAYSKAELSLVVHRIGKTLLLDELDLPAILNYVSQTKNASGLRWLYDFYCEQRGIPKDSDFKRKKNKDEAKQKNIFSKFLHYSIQKNEEEQGACSSFTKSSPATDSKPSPIPARHPGKEQGPERTEQETTLKGNEKSQEEEAKPKPAREHMPSPGRDRLNVFPGNEEDVLPEPHQMSSFQRNILWTFEDLHMLVGSNVPIFGGGKYPAVSLRLRDCGKPINVLTGLDYWLDNLMCNVPEVAMCYHLDGLVQYYDLFKTEELPHLEGSSFSPKVVKDIAQNVLSFMKSNCTQEGHTYWLFKASDSEVVKLYDLTSICDQNAEKCEKYQNPFTVPVGMLFYRVAKNMMKEDSLDAGDQSIVKLLLDSCMGLLDHQQFPEIMTSANILLSNLFSPDNIHTVLSLDKTSDSRHSSQEDLTSERHEIQNTPVDVMAYRGSLEVGELSTPGMYQDDIRKIAKTITNNAEIRCKKALSYIVEGLRCLKLGLATDEEAVEMDDSTSKDDSSHGNSTPQGSHSRSQPQTFSVRRVNALESSRPSLSQSSEESHQNPLLLVKPVDWREQSKSLLMRKATSVYHSMACLANTKGKYGRGLRFCKLSLECLEAYKSCGTNYKNEEDNEMVRSILCACADSFLMLAKCGENLEVHHDEFLQRSGEDKDISVSAKELICGKTETFKVEFKSVIEDNLITSADFYTAALDMTGKETKLEEYDSLARRVGNVKNELGVYFMNRAALMVANGEGLVKQRDMWKKSFLYFESGMKAFEAIDDQANLALLHSNAGRLMRLCAQAVRTDKSSQIEFSSEEKHFYKQAIEFYNRALQSLAERKVCAEVWDAVTWELSGAYFTMATLLQDYPPLSVLSQQEVEKEITELMMKALKLCEPTGKGSVVNIRPQSPEDLDRRLGSIHHRLASLYHNAYRNEAIFHSILSVPPRAFALSPVPVSPLVLVSENDTDDDDDDDADQARKKVRSLAELHYSKACTYFKASSFPCQWIRIHLERVALCEHQIALHSRGSAASIKILQNALHFVLESRKALEILTSTRQKTPETDTNEKRSVKGKENEEEKTAMKDRKTALKREVKNEKTRIEKSRSPVEKEEDVRMEEEDQEDKRTRNLKAAERTKDDEEQRQLSDENTKIVHTDGKELTTEYLNELGTLIPILEGRLHHLLKETVKFWSTKKGKNKDLNVRELEKAKQIYSLALRESVGEKHEENCVKKGINLVETLEKIEKMKLQGQ